MNREQKALALEERVRRIEDRLAIQELIARYAFEVDCGAPPEWRRVFARDVRMEAGKLGTSQGIEEIEQRFSRAEHLAAIREGSQHAYTNLVIEIDESGNAAMAWGYACVHVRRGDTFAHHTLGVNRWCLAKEEGEWRITERLRREVGEDGWKSVIRPMGGD